MELVKKLIPQTNMKQEKNNYCLCAILQDVLLEYNIFISQEEIAKNLTSAENGFMADDGKIKKFMKHQGFNYRFYWYNEISINEPNSLLEEISKNNGFVGVENHTYRVLKFTEKNLSLCDPKDNSIQEKKYFELLKEIWKKDGGFGLIEKLN